MQKLIICKLAAILWPQIIEDLDNGTSGPWVVSCLWDLMEDESTCDLSWRWTNRVAAFKTEGKGENWPTSCQCPGNIGAYNQMWTSSHLVIKGMSTKWAKANLFPLMANHQSYRKERGSRCHVSWLPSAFDSVSDAILIISKLKREIYKRVTQGLSNCSKRGSHSRHSGCTRNSRAGWCQGWHCHWCRWGDSVLGWGETQGAIQNGDKLIWAGAIRQEQWTNPARQLPGWQIAGQEAGLWAKAWEHSVFETKANATLGCTNKGMAHKVQAQALFLYPAGSQAMDLGYDSLRSRAPQLDTGAAMWLTGGLETSPMRKVQRHCPCSAWRRKEGYFNMWGRKAEGNYSALCLWGSKAVSG